MLLFSCQSSEENNTKTAPVAANQEQINSGLKHAMAVQKVLGGNLKAAMQAGGPMSAVEFCHLNALALTDSAASAQGVRIKRVSDQERNSKNAANADELAYITAMKDAINGGEAPSAAGTVLNGQFTGYYPITTQELCLKCHGNPGTQVTPELATHIASKYPEDKALGYGVGELRGIWVVEFPVEE